MVPIHFAISYQQEAHQVKIYVTATEKVESVWNFANKIWNASRFALMNMNGLTYEEIDLTGEKSVADKWILTRLNETIETVTSLSEKYEFGEVGRALYNFIWDDFCDWYIEMAKLPLYGEDEAAKKTTRSILAYVLDQYDALIASIYAIYHGRNLAKPTSSRRINYSSCMANSKC